MTSLPFSKLCELGDFVDPELAPVIRDVCGYKLPDFGADFPCGAEHRKDWEVAMAVRALRHFGALRPDATVLGVAAGTEDTIFYLAQHVRQVFATDRYLSSGPWQPVAPISMLLDPEAVARSAFDPDRLVVQHMDGRRLLYPADTFDGIFSSGSIEHFGDFHDVAAAAYEMGRVLKPGGVLSLSTEFRLAGPPGGIGWPGSTLLFSAGDLQRFIVEASGLELVDDLRTGVSDETLSTPRDITKVIDNRRLKQAGGPDVPVSDDTTWDDRPHIVLLHDGYVFTSVHLTLRKTERYPWPANEWARPTPAMLESIAAENRSILQRSLTAAPAPAPPAAPPASDDLVAQQAATSDALAAAVRCAHAAEAGAIALGPLLPDAEAAMRRIDVARHDVDTLLVRAAGLAADAERRVQNLPPAPEPVRAERLAFTRVPLARGLDFSVVTDPGADDPIAWALSKGVTVDEALVNLMLDVIGPGDKVLDLGAHVGTFTLAAAAAGADVLAVEGAPRNVALLRESIRRNRFSNARVVHAAVGDHSAGTVEFFDDGARGRVSVPGDAGATVGVPAVTVGDLLFELRWGPVAFVKMDVEGSEIRAVRGMRYELEQADAPAILYEANGHTLGLHGETPEALMAELEGLGYASYLVEQGRLVRVHASELQPQTILDYLAVKRLPRGLTGWRVEPVLTFEERLTRLRNDARHENPDHRAYIAGALRRAGDDLLSHADVAACLAALAGDPEPAVREAAAWSTGDRVGSATR